ncbi:Nucleotide-binding universal stress protein, UspA family [Streptomyces sp. DI166]|uniref:universal stress protein n=1 Tax=unclassified Streptomyces TaxID=2593676 RepID=UPI0007F40566|nr:MULTISPECIES: universal stress protein [unclassified Streptomyces]SBT89645.1 Nucleotide-binding universal stress protein, UspA family [Streptomyces sp. DI166]
MTPQYVVVGADGSLNAVRALDWASDEAARREAALRIVYAVPDRDEAAPVLGAAVARAHARHPRLRVASKPVTGGPVAVLARESEGAALTVVGTRGLGPVSGLLARSVSLGLAVHAAGPLLVVRGDHPCDGERRVLLGLESDEDAEAAAYAFAEARRRGVGLDVVHCWTHRHITPELPSPIPATSPGQRELAVTGRSEGAVARFSLAGLKERFPTIDVETRTVRTGPARALLDATADAAVVVIGTRRRRPGPVAHTLLHRSHCPVVLVPTR